MGWRVKMSRAVLARGVGECQAGSSGLVEVRHVKMSREGSMGHVKPDRSGQVKVGSARQVDWECLGAGRHVKQEGQERAGVVRHVKWVGSVWKRDGMSNRRERAWIGRAWGEAESRVGWVDVG